jgi:putative hydrolase of the HAD superfamily
MLLRASNERATWSGCRWLIFDAVGTLIQPNPSVAAAYHSIAARHGSRFTVAEIGERFRRAFRQSENDVFPNGPAAGSYWLSSDAIEIARWRWIVGEVVPDVDDREKCFTELWDHFAQPSSWTCFDDVQNSLVSLEKASYRLAIASNFDSRLHAVCAGRVELRPIEHRFVSSETGFRKPAKEFYSAVVSHCGCPASEILMIGDDPNHDVAGPVAIGMQAILLDRRAEVATSNTIHSLTELMPHERCRVANSG